MIKSKTEFAGDLAAVGATFDAITPTALALLHGRSPNPVAHYLGLLEGARRLNLVAPVAADFRRQFNGFYGVRRNAVWRERFYELFEEAKSWDGGPKQTFVRVLTEMHRGSGRAEASFASKLTATLDPTAPVIDSVVRAFLDRFVEAPRFGGGFAQAVVYFDWLQRAMAAIRQLDGFQTWRARFDAEFAGVPGASDITDMKKLDFLIWAGSRS